MGTGTGQGGYNVSVRAVFPFLSPAGVKKHLPDFLRDVRPDAASLFRCVLMNGRRLRRKVFHPAGNQGKIL
ncbi:hypothetical protein D5282_07800 [bacterium 1xD8-48]|nr:hypothetical protein [bacterium 1xD8-48]